MSSAQEVSIIGQGYVGLPLAIAAANAGWKVNGIEVDLRRFETIVSGISPIEDVSNDVLGLALRSGNYTVNKEFSTISNSSVIVICVPTPLLQDRSPDLSAIHAVVREIALNAQDECLIISESTSYPGTLRNEIEKVLSQLRPGNQMHFVAAPERVDPGNTQFSHINTPRIIGGTSTNGTILASKFYESFTHEVIICDTPEIVEMAKLLENSFRLVNIALVNELSEVCHKSDIDIWKVIAAAKSKPYGFMPFYPGLGIGGHCIPIDPAYLAYFADQFDSKVKIIETSLFEMNSKIKKVTQIISSRFKRDASIGVIGLGYKMNSKDLRESPSIELIQELKKLGFQTSWLDPNILNWEGEEIKVPKHEDAIVYVLPYLDKDQLREFGGLILDCTGILRDLPNAISI